MPRPQNALAAYQAAIATTPPLQAVVLLYDGVLTRIRNAALAVGKGDFFVQYSEIQRANEILRGLNAALDGGKGGPLADKLRDTYETNMRALMRSVGRRDGDECLRRIGDGLRQLRNAWAEIAGMAPLAPPDQH
jgi:flagellar secretion chaperone FliS